MNSSLKIKIRKKEEIIVKKNLNIINKSSKIFYRDLALKFKTIKRTITKAKNYKMYVFEMRSEEYRSAYVIRLLDTIMHKILL